MKYKKNRDIKHLREIKEFKEVLGHRNQGATAIFSKSQNEAIYSVVGFKVFTTERHR
ncbi:hypothetical protein [Clostridium sp.]|uniref:hypothetical protein n=1 Tax=Clostridium sp. TaxID=1506 RepID=UPI003217DD11